MARALLPSNISHATLATIQQTFRTSTGWHLDLDPTITIEEPADTRLPDDQKGD